MAIMNKKENKGLKNHCIYTTNIISKNIYKILKEANVKVNKILDPSVGEGFLTNEFKESVIFGVDIDEKGKDYCNHFYHEDFEFFDKKLDIDLILCNPPFNGHKNRKLYPEVFLKKIVEIYGNNAKIVMIVPSGLRLNQKLKSKRWKWINENLEITSILTLPLDVFEGVLFHTEVLFFNIENIKAHYFLDLEL